MMTSIRTAIVLCLVASCGFPRPGDVGSVGGRVHGLWSSTDGVALRLQAPDTDALFVVTANGPFSFAEFLPAGTSYTVTVTGSPARHSCAVDAGGNGTVGDASAVSVSIACTGPQVAVEISGPWGWRFDPTQEVQTFAGSIATQEIALRITGETLTRATVAGGIVTLGQAIGPIELALGSTTIPIELTTATGLSKSYDLVFERGGHVVEQVAYGKSSNTGENDSFGSSIAVSGDTIVVGTVREASGATGVNGNQNDNSAREAGAVYVFVRNGAVWTQQAYIKASNTGAFDQFGYSVSLSGDTLAVGAPLEASTATGINGSQNDNSAFGAGAVYIFVRTGVVWTQQAYIKASNTHPPLSGEILSDSFGQSVALSGHTLVVGAPGEDSSATGVNRDQTSNDARGAGAAYVFTRDGSTWTQQAYLKASNTGPGDAFGAAVALSDDTLVVGATAESSNATGVNGNQADDSFYAAGAVYVFVRVGSTWTQQAYVKASNTTLSYGFGSPIAISGDILAVTSVAESSSATGINGNQADTSAVGAGAVYVFHRRGSNWTQQAYVKASNTATGDNFGTSLGLSGDTLVVASPNESSAATGINGDQSDNAAFAGAGAGYVFHYDGANWVQRLYLKASNTGTDGFGRAAAISGDAIVVGAPHERSSATGINPVNSQADNSLTDAGAFYIFR